MVHLREDPPARRATSGHATEGGAAARRRPPALWRRLPVTGLLALVVAALHPLSAPAQEGLSDAEAVPAGDARILGEVVDEETGEPIVGAYVRLEEAGRAEFTHADGTFHFERLAAGTYTVKVERIGYGSAEERVEVAEDGVQRITIRLRTTAIGIPGVVVTGVGRERRVDQTYRPTAVLEGRELQRNLSWSLAATLQGEPGLAMQSFGPAPAQPVIRGMGSDRVLVLEDGSRMGDLSHTAPDHAVGVDPISADRVEVLRGPAGLLFGSNALGGVVNTIREEVPRTLPQHTTGTVTTQGESVNRGYTGSAVIRAPVGRAFAVRGEATFRQGSDIRTPLGRLDNTDSRGYNLGVGASWLPDWGYVGTAFRAYELNHGIPGEFDGELIPGAHEGGVNAESSRILGRFQAGHTAGLGPFNSVELDGNLIHYLHQEIEGERADGTPIVGAEFDQLTGTVDVVGRHEHEPGELRAEGAVGLSFLWQDLLTARQSGSRPATEHQLAAYFYEELDFEPLRFQFGARYDWTRIRPHETDPIQTLEEEIPVETRTFGDFSGSVALLWDFWPGWTLGGSVARAFRTPAIPELFSDGPHLADFSYDIGNPALESETGLGGDLFVRVERPTLRAEATVFANSLSNYIYYNPTGEDRVGVRTYPIFQAEGDDALFAGADGRIQWEAVRGLVLDATASYVRATRVDDDDPLPEIPPFNGGLGVRYETSDYFLTAGWRGAARQDRVPNPIPRPGQGDELILPEQPTPGYGLLKVGGGYQWALGETVHSITLQVDNVADRAYRDHLSRIKDVAPEPGRNVQLLYRVGF